MCSPSSTDGMLINIEAKCRRECWLSYDVALSTRVNAAEASQRR